MKSLENGRENYVGRDQWSPAPTDPLLNKLTPHSTSSNTPDWLDLLMQPYRNYSPTASTVDNSMIEISMAAHISEIDRICKNWEDVSIEEACFNCLSHRPGMTFT